VEFKLEYILNDEIKTFYLNKDVINIGKLQSNDLHINDNSISRKHCQLVKTESSFILTDLESTNGTYLNGKKTDKAELEEGDTITIGRSIFNFLSVSKKESYNDQDNQKISMVVPLTDEFRIDDKEKIEPYDLNLLTSLTSLGKDLITSSSIGDSFGKVAKLIFQFLNLKRLFIFSYDQNQEELVLKHSQTQSGKSPDKVNISKTIAMKAIKEKVAILSSNTMDDSRFDGAKSIILYGITSAISVPIWTKTSIYGLIYIDTTDFTQILKEKDLSILSIIANFTGLSIEGINSLNKLNQEKKLRSRLERYHSPSVVSRIMESQNDKTQELISYKETVATVLFMDIVGFTTKAENKSPVEIGLFLNNFFSKMTDVIFLHQGTLDKYIGDAIMAVFGVPFENDNHAELSLLTAIDMIDKLNEMNKDIPPEDQTQIRIGINSGKLIAGDFGSPKRYDYTVIGNTVNVASRLESSIAGPDEIMVSESVYELTKGSFKFKFLGEKKLHGISKLVKAYKVLKKLEKK
jgi:adenylate cyclase